LLRQLVNEKEAKYQLLLSARREYWSPNWLFPVFSRTLRLTSTFTVCLR
jgi:hypothetical protein